MRIEDWRVKYKKNNWRLNNMIKIEGFIGLLLIEDQPLSLIASYNLPDEKYKFWLNKVLLISFEKFGSTTNLNTRLMPHVNKIISERIEIEIWSELWYKERNLPNKFLEYWVNINW